MPNIFRFRVLLGGFSGAPGLNTLFVGNPGTPNPLPEGLQDAADLVGDAYNEVLSFLASGVTVNIEPVVTELVPETGEVVKEHSITSWAQKNATGTGDESRATQAKLRFRADEVINRQFLRGGNFIGPLSGNAMGQSGTLSPTAITQIGNMFNGLTDPLGDLMLVLWHRPVNQTGGQAGVVKSVSCNPVPAVLRGRRD